MRGISCNKVRYVVVDETHVYSRDDNFGPHVGGVLKRLYRVINRCMGVVSDWDRDSGRDA